MEINYKKKFLVSIILKLILIVFVIIGIAYSYFEGYVGGPKAFLYFTTQSNIWIALIDLILVIELVIKYIKNDYYLHKNWYLSQQIFTISILITGIVYNFILAPAAFFAPTNVLPDRPGFYVAAIMLHTIVPILAIVDYFLFVDITNFKKIDFLYGLIPFAYYAIFAITGYILNWDFKDGANYPYFFFNFNSPASIFGFSNEMPYIMGSFYWGVIIIGLVLLVSWLLIFIPSKIKKRKQAKHQN